MSKPKIHQILISKSKIKEGESIDNIITYEVTQKYRYNDFEVKDFSACSIDDDSILILLTLQEIED